ncbi:MAG: hypothetical protein FWE09_06410 [Treponema sp.]|nr:hypothetical protein [Treponema sp.]
MKRTIALALLALALFAGCSTQPRNQGEITDMRRQAEAQLGRGNRQADRSEPEGALFFIEDALRLAILADDSGLRARAGLSLGNALFALGLESEARAAWAEALAEAESSGSRELVALARSHAARGALFSAITARSGAAVAQSVVEELARERPHLRDPLFVAFSWTVEALALGELGRFAQAEAASARSRATHERARLFELAAFDWFMIASFRSRSGDLPGARAALEASIELDRRVENSWGLAASWRALGDVQTRAGNREAAAAAYARSAGIFSALGHEAAAQDALSRAP